MYAHTDMKYMHDAHLMHQSHMNNQNFNHPFSITNLMSQQQQQQQQQHQQQQEAEAKNMDLSKLYQQHHDSQLAAQQQHDLKQEQARMYHDIMQGQYASSPYGHLPVQLPPVPQLPPKDVSPTPATSSAEQDGYYRSYTPQSTVGL